MNVLFLNPPFKVEIGKFSRNSRSPAITKSGTVYYPFWLAYATGVLEKEQGFDVKFIDACADRITLPQVYERLGGFIPDLVVMETSTPSIYNDVRVADQIKSRFPKTFICLVGTHVSSLPKETLQLSPNIDAIVKGEYDYTVRELAQTLSMGGGLQKVKGLCLRKGKDLVFTGERQHIENLDDLPFVTSVYKKHLNIRNYYFGAAQYPMVMIITGRGCIGRCKFCVYPQTIHGRAYRPRSPESVVDELEYIKKELPFVREVGIEDDTFTIDKQRVRMISELIIERGLKVRWYANTRADLDYETMVKMKAAGCRLVTCGFESGSQQILNNIAKGIAIIQIREFVKDSKKAGLMVHAAYMVGNIGETRETMEQTLAFAKEMDTDMVQFFPIMLYPGTESYDWAKEKGYIMTTDFSKWLTEDGQYDCVLSTPELTNQDLFNFCDRALREYYFRPKFMVRKTLQNILHPGEAYRNVRSSLQLLKRVRWTPREVETR
jgi:radical SAM superfamily enzyme YgiQ (UPF0313 family)